MKKGLVFLLMATVIFMCLTPGISKAVIIDFEDLPYTPTNAILPSNYMGFSWWTFDYFHRDFYNGVHSGLFAINNNAATTYIDFGSVVDFNGAYFTKYPPHVYSVTITGYHNEQILYERVLEPEDLNTDPKYIQLDFNGITKITFYSPDAQFFVDDLYINEQTPTIEDILAFFDASVADGTLEGSGPGNSAAGRLNALRSMLVEAGVLIEDGNMEEACGQIMAAYKKCDVDEPEFVDGVAVSELSEMILELMEYLGCE